MMGNLIQFEPIKERKAWLNIELIKYSVFLKQPLMYFCYNSRSSQRMLYKLLPHLNVKIISQTWLEIKPCHCMQRNDYLSTHD